MSDYLAVYLSRVNRGKAAATILDRRYLAGYICEGMGTVRLDRLTPERIQRWLDGWKRSHRGKIKAHQLLRSALQDAVDRGELPRNPAAAAHVERKAHVQKGRALTAAQVRVLLWYSRNTAQINLWTLALQTGARIGELLALEMGDYDPAARTLRIEHGLRLASPDGGKRAEVGPGKTVNARRTFRLPADAVPTLERQMQRVAALRAQAGQDWAGGSLLFPSEAGTHLAYRNVVRAWARAYSLILGPPVIAVPVITLHDLRRTFITLALSRGVKPEVVARMVGHSSPLITLRIYRDIYDTELEEAAEKIDGMF